MTKWKDPEKYRNSQTSPENYKNHTTFPENLEKNKKNYATSSEYYRKFCNLCSKL